MFAQRALARATPRFAPAIRGPLRSSRRNNSSENWRRFTGAEDNEFNRERAHIEEHAGESGG
jgi:cytochrome c oxidase subunit 6a